MTEIYDTSIPRPEELNETLRGMTFEEFKALSDDDVRALSEQILAEQLEHTTLFDDEADHALSEALAWHNFSTWRKYGIPDRNVSQAELRERMSDLTQVRQRADPDYGTLRPEQLEGLPDRERQIIEGVFDYLAFMVPVYEPAVVTDRTLFDELEVEKEDITALLGRGVLTAIGMNSLSGNEYLLEGSYYAHWLVERVDTQRRAQQN